MSGPYVAKSLKPLLDREQLVNNPITGFSINFSSPAEDEHGPERDVTEYEQEILYPEDMTAGVLEINCHRNIMFDDGSISLIARTRTNSGVLESLENELIPLLERPFHGLKKSPLAPLSKVLIKAIPWTFLIGFFAAIATVPWIRDMKLGELTLGGFALFLISIVVATIISISLSELTGKLSNKSQARGVFLWGEFGGSYLNKKEEAERWRRWLIYSMLLASVGGGLIVSAISIVFQKLMGPQP